MTNTSSVTCCLGGMGVISSSVTCHLGGMGVISYGLPRSSDFLDEQKMDVVNDAGIIIIIIIIIINFYCVVSTFCSQLRHYSVLERCFKL